MEDKELQELFAAKRTTEANRRRQEELRQLIGKQAVPKSRRLWPVWVGSAAAAILLLLIVTPLLFRQSETEPMLIAQAETILQPTTDKPLPEEPVFRSLPEKDGKLSEQRVSRPLLGRGGQRPGWVTAEPTKAKHYAEATNSIDSMPTHPNPSQEGTGDAEQLFAMDTPADNGPRIHRRTSTRMVCSDCAITTVPSQSSALQDFLAATFGAEPSTPFTLKSIEF